MLVSLDKVKTYLGLSGTADDALLADLIADATKDIESHLGRTLERADYVEDVDGSGTPALALKNFPINSLTYVRINQDRDFTSDDDEDLDIIVTDSDSGLLEYTSGASWPAGRKNIRVSYNGGYQTTPTDIQDAAKIIVADRYTRAKQLASGQSQNEMTAERIGDRSESYASEATVWGIPALALAKLNRYPKAS